jgi:NADH-quinone oxidoreductase subunit J
VNLEGARLALLYAIIAAGGVGMALIMPRRLHRPRPLVLAGAVFGAAALAGFGVYWTDWIGPDFGGRAFVIAFGLVAVLASALLVISRKPVYSALHFLIVMMAVTGLCILGAAEFLGIALVIVYGGAILVTYVFVIMLAQQHSLSIYDSASREPLAAVLIGFLLVAATTQAMIHRDPIARYVREQEASHPRLAYAPRASEAGDAPIGDPSTDERGTPGTDEPTPKISNVRLVGRTLLQDHVVAMEVAGILLLVAMAGAIAIARKQITPEDLTPEEQALRHADVADIHKRGREAPPF